MGCVALVSLLTACAPTLQRNESAASPQDAIQAAFVVQADNGNAIARVVTVAASCPMIDIDGRARAMQVRAAAALLPSRSGGKQADNKAVAFPVLTCETTLPRGANTLQVGQHALRAPRDTINHIVIIADTGCRMKQSDNAFQDCNDPKKWPFAQIARSAAALQPDLVLHIGDIHYRESPCPTTRTGCAGSPWGYGFDTWNADLFQPAQPLLAAAPWLFVRGNHESCARAGQGWFRFVDTQPWTAARSCDDPAFDDGADYSDPFSVRIDPALQLIVFDSSKAGSKAYAPTDASYKKYLANMQQADRLSRQAPHNFFINHHPVLGFSPTRNPAEVKPGNGSLQSVMAASHPGRLFPAAVDVAMHGHVHLFEAISFSSDHPATFVMGNAGSASEGGFGEHLPVGAQAAPGAVPDVFLSRPEFGFASLDRVGAGWVLTERDVDGRALIRCDVEGSKTRCKKVQGGSH
ncbi:metallophosphoesterase [Actimicrobium antarcticum]|uniref:Metallophosphoesterase n=1 Tax=Actimicrobium antarcticum TaxID=1051899 RepID=A0ABP7TVB2_9BURK